MNDLIIISDGSIPPEEWESIFGEPLTPIHIPLVKRFTIIRTSDRLEPGASFIALEDNHFPALDNNPTFLNKQNVLQDRTAAALNLPQNIPTPDDAFMQIATIFDKKITTYTTPGTYSFTAAETGNYLIESVGGGGAARIAADYTVGGGGGGYARSMVLLKKGSSVTVTVGAGGVGLTTGTGYGAPGNSTSFGTYATGYGGNAGGSGGGGAGDFVINGGDGSGSAINPTVIGLSFLSSNTGGYGLGARGYGNGGNGCVIITKL